ncbi:phenylalanine--tRNA ligase subunit alpha, partial [Candidatus Woesearchaeota archaeon]|nr:phenylalanine--tRNA ligase subunit alpha [Candidatus Woesearchaeota archaeon]
MYVLTEEGRKYLKNGLPEKNLAGVLAKGPVEMGVARKQIENFDIALQWGKKKGFVELKHGTLFLLRKPEFPEEAALMLIGKGKNIDENIAGILLKRNLIELPRETATKRAEKLAGMEITDLTEDLVKTGMWKNVTFKSYNVEAKGRRILAGKRQPYVKFLQDVRRKLVELGFSEMTGPNIETEFWNFDALFQPQDHPSRDWTQTYSLKNPRRGWLPDKDFVEHVKAAHENGWKTGGTGWGYKWNSEKASRLMPRAHGTALSARTLASKPDVPGKYFALSRCYRPDVIDATHGVEFNQLEGIVIDQSLTFRHLLGLLKLFAIEIAGTSRVKFYPDYYPFTEPSVQMSAKHPDMGWIEFGGAGIFREELTKPLGVDVPVIAWG